MKSALMKTLLYGSSSFSQGQLGLLRKQNAGVIQQNQEFSIRNEDFPLLPGFKGMKWCLNCSWIENFEVVRLDPKSVVSHNLAHNKCLPGDTYRDQDPKSWQAAPVTAD
ncbi:hypothetical protein RJ641_001211 [Dillenia turbinata]|uniref:Uncharacterized protein n=1 Tax=Dillenia turbinata TaxID=194707 RepID=A0AAN8W7S7_9MAGN